MKEFESSETVLVADVDCTAEGEALCNKVGVTGYPTLKYGNPSNLNDYEGARDYDALLEFANTNLGPTCGPDHMDLCNDAEKAKIGLVMDKGLEQLQIDIAELDQIIKSAEEYFESEASKLDVLFEKLREQTLATIQNANKEDLDLLKAVRDHFKKKITKHEEL